MRHELAGNSYGKLKVLKVSKTKGARGQRRWDCLCECGKEKNFDTQDLVSGTSTHCGCSRKKPKNTKHGMSNTRLYRIYRHMINRCYHKNMQNYYLYGERGITVCNEWRDSFQAFADWSLSNGYSEELTIDRRDNDGMYCPENCRWADTNTQARNKRNNVLDSAQVSRMRELHRQGWKNKDLSNLFEVTRTTVSDVVNFKTWRVDGQGDYKKQQPLMITCFGETKMAHQWEKDNRIKVSASTILARKKKGLSDYHALNNPRKTRSNHAI